MCNRDKTIRVNLRHLRLIISAFCFLLSVFSLRAQISINVTNFGAIGDVVRFSVNTVSNSTVVSVAGTNRFSSADVGGQSEARCPSFKSALG